MTTLESITTLLIKYNIKFSIERELITEYYDGYVERPSPTGDNFYTLLVEGHGNDTRIACVYPIRILFNEDQSFHSIEVIP